MSTAPAGDPAPPAGARTPPADGSPRDSGSDSSRGSDGGCPSGSACGPAHTSAGGHPHAPAAVGAGLRLSGVTVRHGSVTALRGVDLDVRPGELLVLLGPSAAGKTTLLRAVAGLDRVAAGTVRLSGRDITALPPGQRDVSMVFQSYALFPHLDVARNIAFGLAVRGVDRRAARERAAAAAAVAGCAHLLDRRPGALSGGERQRVALARALVREPAVFLLDEPLSQLDAELRLSTRGELRALHDRLGATTLHVTHDQAEAMALGDRVAVLRAGQVEQVAGPRELWDRPATRFVARFVGSPPMNLLPAHWVAGAPGGAVEVGVRPEALRVTPGAPAAAERAAGAGPPTPASDAGGAGSLRLAGTVTRCELAGADSYAYLDVGGSTVAVRVPTAAAPAPGTRVEVDAPRADLHFFAGDGARCPDRP